MTQPTLLQEIGQFLYTHAPNMAYKRELLALVKTWEDAYLARIRELENGSLVDQFNRMVDEGGANKDANDRSCECGVCYYCRQSDKNHRRAWPDDEDGGNFGSD